MILSMAIAIAIVKVNWLLLLFYMFLIIDRGCGKWFLKYIHCGFCGSIWMGKKIYTSMHVDNVNLWLFSCSTFLQCTFYSLMDTGHNDNFQQTIYIFWHWSRWEIEKNFDTIIIFTLYTAVWCKRKLRRIRMQ